MARQTPDADGKTIPPGTTEGSAKLSGSRGELQHITASVSVASYNPSRATCNVHCIDCATTLYTSFAPTPAFLSLKVSKTQQMVIIWRTRGGTQYNATAAGTWTASNPRVATVGTGASQPGLVTAQAIGAASVSYESPPIQLLLRTCGDPPECPSGEPVTIDVPTDVPPSATITGLSGVPMATSSSGGPNEMNQSATVDPVGGTYAWSSPSSTVSLSYSTSEQVVVTAISPGQATVNLAYTVNGATANATTTITVQQPTSLSNVTSSVGVSCTSYDPGLKYVTQEAQVLYTVLDQNNNPIQFSGMPVAEVLTQGPNSCSQTGTPTATSNTTTSSGTFSRPDTLLVCSSSCLPANSSGGPLGLCTDKVAQVWNANGYPVQSKTITYTCAGPPAVQ